MKFKSKKRLISENIELDKESVKCLPKCGVYCNTKHKKGETCTESYYKNKSWKCKNHKNGKCKRNCNNEIEIFTSMGLGKIKLRERVDYIPHNIKIEK